MREIRIALVLLILIGLSSGMGVSRQQRSLLAGRMTERELGAVLLPRGQWRPFPTVEDREAWNIVSGHLRAEYVRGAERLLGTTWPPLPASVFLEYVRNGNRSNFERISFERRARLATLVMGEVFENKGRFLDDIANGIWAICEESYWGVPAHVGVQRRGSGLPDVTEPTVDLFAAETGSLLAWTTYLLGNRLDRISPLIDDRIHVEVDRRILTPNLERDDFWWMGFRREREVNNWNPWINSNWLTTVLVLEQNPARRVRAVHKIMRSLDNFLDVYPDDGGCDEGPGYWGRAGASLFDCLELLHGATDGAIDLYGQPLIQRIGQYIYKVYIRDDYYINFADASGRLNPEAGLIYRYGKRIRDPIMAGFGVLLARRQNLGDEARVARTGSLGRLLPDLLLDRELRAASPVEPLLRDAWFPGLQVMVARSFADSTKGLYLAAKGGHNAESHNHNDVGNFIVYADGRPALIDVGVETYTRKTFSNERYEIWTMQSAYHNLPTINGFMQMNGRGFRARDVSYKADESTAVFSLDIAGAYPAEAGVESWVRTLHFVRGKRVELREKYSLSRFLAPLSLSLMTPRRIDMTTPGRILLADPRPGAGAGVAIVYDTALFKATPEDIPVTDSRLKSVWGERITRILLMSNSRDLQGGYTLSFEYTSAE
ncbi:MAG: heparinase II/III family protein [Acidobacteria bacterium]|nr:heparinase II/III family protein [Acidobacteriota bacterium]